MITTTFLGHFNTSNETQCNTTLLDNIVLINTKIRKEVLYSNSRSRLPVYCNSFKVDKKTLVKYKQ